MYDDDAPGAGMVTGIARVERHRRRHRRQRRDGEGWHLLPDDRQEASARPGGRAPEPTAVHLPGRLGRRVPAAAGRRFPGREHFGRIFYNQARMSCAGHPAGRTRHGLKHRGRRVRPGDERRDGHRPRHGHDLPGRPATGEGRDRRGRDRGGSWRRERPRAHQWRRRPRGAR